MSVGVACGAAALGGGGGLRSLDALQHKLEEDRRRVADRRGSGVALAGGAAAGGAVQAASFLRAVAGVMVAPAEGSAAQVGDQPSIEASAVITSQEAVVAPRQPAVPPARPAPACGSPGERGFPRRPPGAAGAACASSAGGSAGGAGAGAGEGEAGAAGAAQGPKRELDVMNFQADRGNFTQILRFLREGPATWQPPGSAEERVALRAEAMYFGCAGMVKQLDELAASSESGP
mmetsp:Transcript_180544/g.572820  ORF Transcript_180544/g.572820 Transcript_180544/m.572820 type:complete len:233 (-) Transcript_180544:8-706(-)